MANKKRIQQANARFAKQEPRLHGTCKALCANMASLILKTGSTEVTVGIKNGQYYERAYI